MDFFGKTKKIPYIYFLPIIQNHGSGHAAKDLVLITNDDLNICQAVGKEVLRHTAENLTPAVLELGGKSPCIVDSTADIPLAAKRIIFGKYLKCNKII